MEAKSICIERTLLATSTHIKCSASALHLNWCITKRSIISTNLFANSPVACRIFGCLAYISNGSSRILHLHCLRCLIIFAFSAICVAAATHYLHNRRSSMLHVHRIRMTDVYMLLATTSNRRY